jgi:hypothetical protein
MEETKKVERIDGTRYVKIGNSVFDTVGKDAPSMQTICECLFCGDRFAGASGKCSIYCKRCKTAESRKDVQDEIDAIKAENKLKGYK